MQVYNGAHPRTEPHERLQAALADIHLSVDVGPRRLFLVAFLDPPAPELPLWWLNFGLQLAGTTAITLVGCTPGGNGQPLPKCLRTDGKLKTTIIEQALTNATNFTSKLIIETNRLYGTHEQPSHLLQ